MDIKQLKLDLEKLLEVKKTKNGPFNNGDEFLINKRTAILVKDDRIGGYRFFFLEINYLSTVRHEDISSLERIKAYQEIGGYTIDEIECIVHNGIHLQSNESLDAIIETTKKSIEKLTRTYRLGDVFKIDGDEYILAQSKPMEFCLISLQTGNRYNNPISFVPFNFEFTYKDISKMCNGCKVEFVRGPSENV